MQKRLCNLLQEGLPVSKQPFAEIAKALNSDETEVLQQTRRLKEIGVIRRLCAIVDYRALGLYGTLVAAHVPEDSLKEVAAAVNLLPNVSHNYRREHYYNLWFTLQDESLEQIKLTLLNLSGRFNVDFHSMPVKRVFKLDVRFDAESRKAGEEGLLPDVEKISKGEPVELNKDEKLILSKLQDELDLIAEPFDFLCSGSLLREDVLKIIKELIDKGVIRRIAAVVDHRKLGFVANVLFVGEVPQEKIISAGKRLARFEIVTHCYERETFENWPYNLFAMMHAQSMGQIQHVIKRFTAAEKIDSFQLLPTAAEFKKQPIKYW
jgi:DNA-binding Lrp family transcriptional regulator